ncbi:MAG: sugar ABC transporter permease, partial [Anaerolineaceae bacterium]
MSIIKRAAALPKPGKAAIDRPRVTARTFLEPAVYLAPFLVGIILFTLYPFLNVILISFKEGYKLNGTFTAFGIENYAKVISDPYFLNGLRNTGLYVLAVVPIATVISLLFANLLNNVKKFKGFFQTAYFLPMVTSVTAIGLVWKWLFNFDYGLINYVLSLLGAAPINWLNNPAYNLTALIIYGVWSMLPFTIILLLAGLQNVNPLYYTTARADGAKAPTIFFRITLPLLAPTIGLTLIINMISA